MKRQTQPVSCPKCSVAISPADQTTNEELSALLAVVQVRTPCQQVISILAADRHADDCAQCTTIAQANIQKTVVPASQVKAHVNRSTFTCPLCQTPNLERTGLLEHMRSNHRGKPGVCPICITYSYGDANYVSRNLSAHLDARHAYEMGEVIENETDEQQQLAIALANSLGQSAAATSNQAS